MFSAEAVLLISLPISSRGAVRDFLRKPLQKIGTSTVLSTKLKVSVINNSFFWFAELFEAGRVSLGCIATNIGREQSIHSALDAF